MSASVLVLAGPVAAAAGLTGTYKTTISGQTPAALNGSWQVGWSGGKETISHSGAVVVSGHYAVAGNRITMSRESGPLACTGGTGVYSWSLRGKLLTLKVVKDGCAGRKLILTSHPLHKVG